VQELGAVSSVNFQTRFDYGFQSSLRSGNLIVSTTQGRDSRNFDFNVFRT
jgi:hypothetical protein